MDIKIGIIGLGGRAEYHCKAIQSNRLKLIGIADPVRDKCKYFQNKYHINNCYDSHTELLENNDINTVVITLGHHLHHKITIDACNAGKNVLVEKPMALSLSQCDEMINAAKNNNVKLQIGLSQHYYGTSIKAKEILDSNELGPIISAVCYMNKNWNYEKRTPQYRSRFHGGGMWLTNGIHVVDRLTWIIGSQAYSISASISNRSYSQAADDSASAFIRYKNGLTGHALAIGYENGGPVMECYVVGSKGSLRFAEHPKKFVLLGKNENWHKIEFDDPPNENHNEWKYFSEAIFNDLETATHGEWGRHIMEILFAAESSSIIGKEIFLDQFDQHNFQKYGHIVSQNNSWI